MKQAALRVAALAPADRVWILARLGNQERERLLAQLRVLDKLGAARLGAELAQVIARAAPPPVPQGPAVMAEDSVSGSSRGRASGLGRASAEELLAVLAELPAPCADIVADALPPGRRHLLESKPPGAGAAVHRGATSHLATALVQVVERRLAAIAEAGGASVPPAGTMRSPEAQA